MAYHPSVNGLVERAVQTFKLGMKKQVSGTIETKLCMSFPVVLPYYPPGNNGRDTSSVTLGSHTQDTHGFT